MAAVEPSSNVPARANCQRYSPGHTPHVIQVRLSQQSPPEDWWRVVVLGTVGEMVLLAVGDGEVRRYRNHEPAYLESVVGEVGAEAMLNTDYGALFCRPRPDGGSAVFSLQDADQPAEPCSPGEVAMP